MKRSLPVPSPSKLSEFQDLLRRLFQVESAQELNAGKQKNVVADLPETFNYMAGIHLRSRHIEKMAKCITK